MKKKKFDFKLRFFLHTEVKHSAHPLLRYTSVSIKLYASIKVYILLYAIETYINSLLMSFEIYYQLSNLENYQAKMKS